MKKIFIILALISLTFAIYPGIVTLEPFEFKDFGSKALPNFTMTLSMDCPSATISQHLESGGVPVSGAKSYLKYVQYQVPLISSGITDSNGDYTHKLPGNISYYTGIFTLTAEKSGYQKHEAHFEISKCFVNVTAPPPVIVPPPNVTPPEPNVTIPDPECTNDNECANGEFCNLTSNECEFIFDDCSTLSNQTWDDNFCCSDSDCIANQECNMSTFRCESIRCNSGSECDMVESCQNDGTYIQSECVGGRCYTPDCKGLEPGLCPLGLLLLLMPIALLKLNDQRRSDE